MRLLFLIVFLTSSALYALTLSGNWVAHSPQKDTHLRFLSESELSYDGERLLYVIQGNVIRVATEYGYTDYPFSQKGDTLRISFPEGYQLTFEKEKKSKATAQGNNTHLLRGRYCSFSSSYNGGYSTTRWVLFDGQGRFRTGSGSSYSGDNGGYYGSGDNGSGSYRVEGKNISLQTNDGSIYEGKVIEWDNNSHVTGVNINGRVYGTAICD
jgi:hypothetical protein